LNRPEKLVDRGVDARVTLRKGCWKRLTLNRRAGDTARIYSAFADQKTPHHAQVNNTFNVSS
jgi:hypothetical protein